MKIRELKRGVYFTLKEIAEPKENQVYIKGDYNRATKRFSCTCFSDCNNEKFVDSNKEVYTDFVF